MQTAPPPEQLRPRLAEAARELLTSPAAKALGGLSLCLRCGGEEVLREGYGGFAPGRSGGIASGTKWLVAALALRVSTLYPTRLSLGTTPAALLPGWGADEPRKAGISLRMLLSHTSGLPGTDASVGADGLTLREAADRIGALPLQADPGAAFYYGECGFSVVGAMVEAATGMDVHSALREYTTAPLGMTETRLGSDPEAPPANPHLGGGAVSSAPDYSLLLEALHESWAESVLTGGTRAAPAPGGFIAPALLGEMFADQTAHCGRPFAYTPYTLLGPARARRDYGLGCWREELAADGSLSVAGSQGRSGFSPWIDFETGLCGCLYVEQDFLNTTAVYEELRRRLGALLSRLR